MKAFTAITLPEFQSMGMPGGLVVDGGNGIDAKGLRGSSLRAFKTLSAAKAAAQSGDTIHVMPGVYRDANLLKNGVNWNFMPGAKVYRTQGNSEQAPAIFDDGANGTNGPVNCTIGGYGEFWCDDVDVSSQGLVLGDEENALNPGLLMNIYNASTNIAMWCKGFFSTTINNSGGVFMIHVRNCEMLSIYADAIDTIANAQVGGILWIAGPLRTNIPLVRCKHQSGNGGTYPLWASEPAAGSATDWHHTGDILEADYSALLFDGATPNYKMWLTVKEIRSINQADAAGNVNLAAIEMFNNGKLYVTAQKILSRGPTGSFMGPAFMQTGGELWVKAMKITAEQKANQSSFGANAPLFINQTGGEAIYDVDEWETVGNFTSVGGVRMSGGVLTIKNGEMNMVRGRGVHHTGGTTRLKSMRIRTAETNDAAHDCVLLGANGLTLDNSTLIAPALANSVDGAGGPWNMLTTVGFSNRPLNAAQVTVTGAGIFTDDPAWT